MKKPRLGLFLCPFGASLSYLLTALKKMLNKLEIIQNKKPTFAPKFKSHYLHVKYRKNLSSHWSCGGRQF